MNYSSLIRSVYCSSENLPIISEKSIIKDMLSTETGWDRVKRVYVVDEFGFSPEMNYVITTSKFTVACGAFFGGFVSMKKAKEKFTRQNKASKFDSLSVAKKSLYENVTTALIVGGAKTAVKYGAFGSLYLLSTMSIANYRNKLSVWEHIASAAALGGLSKINHGLKGFAVAGVLGGVLGFVAGGLLTLMMGVDGMTMDEFRCRLHDDHYLRLASKKSTEVKEDS